MSAPVIDSDKIRRTEELLKEVDSLALLLDEVKRQSEKIQAAADAIGDAVFEVFPVAGRGVTSLSADGKRELSIGRLPLRSRADGAFSL